MQHIAYVLKAVTVVIGVFIVTNYVGFSLLKSFVSDSRFRVVVAADAANYLEQNQPVNLFIGNSRIMGGIDSTTFSEGRNNIEAYNLAYNGLYLNDLQMLLTAFMRSCSCAVAVVYAHPDIFQGSAAHNQIASSLHKFLSAFNLEALSDWKNRDPLSGLAVEFFPLLHFNNEFFLRAFYYKVFRKDDQDHGNNYTFVVTRETERRLVEMPPAPSLQMDVIESLKARLAATGTALVIIQPPYHKAYIDNVPDFHNVHEKMASKFAERGIDYFDHSRLFYDQPELFADPIHLNREGQQRYSRYLQGVMHLEGGG